MRIVEVEAAETYDLRRAVLRQGRPDVVIALPEDLQPATLHLAAVDADGRIIGVVTAFPEPCAWRPGRRAWHFRQMAVTAPLQGQGVGRELMAALLDHARAAGVEVLWAQGRDAAIGFYTRIGFEICGNGYIHGVSQLPHHDVVCDL